MKTFIVVLLTTLGLSATAGVRSAVVTTLEEDVSKRQSALVSLLPEDEGTAPKEIRVQRQGYTPGGPVTAFFDITSISTDACGNTIYEATLRQDKPKIPEYHYEAKLVDYSDRICFIHRPFQWEFTITFRDDLKGTTQETKFHGIPSNEASSVNSLDARGGTVEVKFKTDKGRTHASYIANYTAVFQCRSLGGTLGERILFSYDEVSGDTLAVYACYGSNS